MKFQELKKYLSVFVFAVVLIIVYKTFDNFGVIIDALAFLLDLLTPFIIGTVIALILKAPCRRIEILLRKPKLAFLKKHRRGLAVISIYLIVIASIALIMTAIIPQLIESITAFAEQLPDMITSLIAWINSFSPYKIENISVQQILESDFLPIKSFLQNFNIENVNKYAKSLMDVGSSVFKSIFGIIISVYILLERKEIGRALSKFSRAYLPDKFRRRTSYYLKMIINFVNRYISCQLLDALVVYILCLIVLSIMRVDYAALIALMVGSFNLIPYFGAFTAILIAALITFVSNGFMSALILVIMLVVIQQVDTNIIQPRLVANSLSTKPLLVILGVLIGNGLFGILGIFIGVPLVALTKNILTEIVDNRLEKKQKQNSQGVS